MLFNVPQFINIEDKIVGPFTVKQLGWLITGSIILLILWNILTTSTFIIFGLIVGGIFGALAFYRPYNQPLSKFIMSGFYFILHPKIYVWRRNYDNIKTEVKPIKKKEAKSIHPKKRLTKKKVKEISQYLDKS